MRRLLKSARKLLRPFVPVLLLMLLAAARFCFALNKLVGWSYLKLWPIFGIHWYDHDFDYLLAPACNRSAERGILANRYIKSGDIVLDVACGDGSLSGNFYSRAALQVDAFDYDEKAISYARKKNAKENIRFFVADASETTFPQETYDVIVLFAVVEHFTAADGAELLQRLGKSVKPGGVLIGSTLFTKDTANNEVHRNKFSSAEQLKKFLDPHFDHVDLWCSRRPGRIDCYFECRGPRSTQSSYISNTDSLAVSS